MNKQELIEQFAKSWVDFCTNLLAEVETEKEQINEKLEALRTGTKTTQNELNELKQKFAMERNKRKELGQAFIGFKDKQVVENEQINEKLKTIKQERQEEIEQRKELDEAFKFALETLGTEVRAIQNELSEAKQAFITERNKRKELGQVVEDLQEENKSLKQDLQSVFRGLDALKQENDRLRQENANLRQLEANWSKHIQDDTRHIKRVTGPTPQSQAKASEVNHQRAEETNIKVFRAIFGYLQNAQDKSKVDMSWLLKTTGLSESTIRQTVKELQEGKLNKHIQKQQNGFLLYGLPVPPAFISWKAKANFFNVSR